MTLPQRKQTRLTYYDYSTAGWYFVTVCTHEHKTHFGKIVDGSVQLSWIGRVVEDAWNGIADHFGNVALDLFTVMPNHLHGIVVIERVVGDTCVVPTGSIAPPVESGTQQVRPGPQARSLSAIVGSFKSAVSKKLKWKSKHSAPLWQRGFFDHVIRSEEGLYKIREYILNNPVAWMLDSFNQRRDGKDKFEEWLSGRSDKL